MSVSLGIAILLLLPGLALVFIPVFPALPYLFVVSLIYGVMTDFSRLSGFEIVILLSISIAAIMVDQLAGVLGAKYGGATKKAMLAGFIGTIIGAIVFGPLGAFACLFLGILLAELSQFRSHAEALKAAKAGLIGSLIGYVTNICLALIFFVCFLAFTLQG